MLNDKFICEASCNFVYRIDELKDLNSSLNKLIKDNYPSLQLIDISENFEKSNLTAISFKDLITNEVAIIYQGSTNINDWKSDNLNNFLNKSVTSYKMALNYYLKIVKDNNVIYLGGNSLGGGCAQYVALEYPHLRTICINAAPLQKITSENTKNIYHIRVSSDLLHRVVSLDKLRFENGYPGSIINVNRSLYGEFDYYNCVELAHRGAIIFPYSYIYYKYQISSIEELKDIVDFKTYMEYEQLKYAPTIAEFMSFDLITNNIEEHNQKFDIKKLNDNFSIRINEISKSINSYHLRNLELKIGQPFISINNEINKELKNIIKKSLLSITKQDETLYQNIYFVIEKSTDYLFSLITKNLSDINNSLEDSLLAKDYQKILRDIDINKNAINDTITNLNLIKESLDTFDKFDLKKITYASKLKQFNHYPTSFSYNYQDIIFDRIDISIKNNVINNKTFIEQLDNFIFLAFKAAKITLNIPLISKNSLLQSDDIDYIINNYSLSDILEEGMYIFKEEIYETILSNSMLYIYQTNIRCINEQLEQLLNSIHNLEYYVEQSSNIYSKKLINKLIEKTKDNIIDLISFNKKSL